MRVILGYAALLLLAAGTGADDKQDEKIDPAKLVGRWKSRADYSKSLPIEVVGIYEFTKDGKMSLRIAPADKPTTELKGLGLDGTYKVNGRKLEMDSRVVGSKEEEKVTMEVVKLTDTTLHLKRDNGKVEECDRVKEEKKKDK